MSDPSNATRTAEEAEAKVEASGAENEDGATPAEDIKSMRVTLADLSAKGTALYAHKKYEEATDVFSRASDMQAEINGETAPENAEILFHYGRSLFKVGQSKSDVLGGPAAGEKKKKKTTTSAQKPTELAATPAATAADEGKDKKTDSKDDGLAEEKKPLFQFTGDEHFDDSEEEEEQEGEEQEEDDDLATAFEILDLSRVCYLKQLDQLQEGEGEEAKEAQDTSSLVKHIKERLAETHDCLAEISLENERYPNAIEDGRTSLNYKLELYPEESDIIAEAHYKLSLALEFASVTTSDADGKNTKREELDQALRDEATKEMQLAIKSFRLKMQATEAELAASTSDDNELSRKALVEMKEIISDMEQRLVDLEKDPINAQDLMSNLDVNPLGGLFGASAADVEARIEEAKRTAVDLTGLVRKRAKDKDGDADESAASPSSVATNGKRKAEADDEDAPHETGSKKARVEDAPEE